MATKEQLEFMTKVGIDFPDCEVEDTDVIYCEVWEQGFGPRGFYHLVSKDGDLKDIKVSRIIEKLGKNKRPQRTSSVKQGPIKAGRTKKLQDSPKRKKEKTVVEKVVKHKGPKKRKPKKKTVSKKVRSVVRSTVDRKKQAEDMRARALAFLKK